jgi:hypothetical protein
MATKERQGLTMGSDEGSELLLPSITENFANVYMYIHILWPQGQSAFDNEDACKILPPSCVAKPFLVILELI